MVCTVDEAKTKWCPMVRSATLICATDYEQTAVGGAACNRAYAGDTYDLSLCMADGCMMWVWEGRAEGRCGLAK